MGYKIDGQKKHAKFVRKGRETNPVFEQSLLDLALNDEPHSVNDNAIWLQLFRFDMINHQLQRLIATKLVNIKLKRKMYRFH